MFESVRGEQAAAWRALHEALLDQIGLDDLLDRIARLGQRGGDRLDADRAAAKTKGDGVEIAPVHLVEADRIDVEQAKRAVGDASGDAGGALDNGEIAHAAQQPSGEGRRTARG